MTNKEAKEKLYMEWQKFLEDNIDYAGISDAYKTAFKALEQEPCEDAISRQAVLDLINADWKYEGLEPHVESLPPVTPQPKTGHWISHHHGCEYECSECHDKQSAKSKYCPNCGAWMVEPQERSDKE